MPASLSDHERLFATWLREYAAIPRKLSRAYTFEAVEGEDLHQEMLVQLWRSLPRFRAQARASTWIYRVCLNTALTWQRDRRRRTARITSAPDPSTNTATSEDSPADAHERDDRLAALMRAVRALAIPDRTLVVLALDGLGHGEIGEITGLTENHVGVALLRARRKLAAELKGLRNEL